METGIKMWNPRIHGTGDVTLSIQGRVELLAPAPGETLPRYDRLEFKVFDGEIVCEGVTVERQHSDHLRRPPIMEADPMSCGTTSRGPESQVLSYRKTVESA
jgi:hypothetical protein